MEIDKIKELIHQAVNNLKEELDVIIDKPVDDYTNFFDILDSMDIVNLIMEIEGMLEKELGAYIPLANEYTFDSENSPLISLIDWAKFINTQIEIN